MGAVSTRTFSVPSSNLVKIIFNVQIPSVHHVSRQRKEVTRLLLLSWTGRKAGEISLTSTYIIVREEATWEEAFKSCENLGGSLATLPSIKDARRLLEMMKLWGNTDSNGHYWVGAKATESGVEWGWKWLSGEAIPKPSENDQGYSWDKGGIKYAVGNCLVFETAKQDNTRGFCGAHKCDQKHKYICEHKN